MLIAPVDNTAMKTGPDLVAVVSDSNQRGSRHGPELFTLDAAGRQIGAQPTPVDGPSEDTDAEIVTLHPLTLLFPQALGTTSRRRSSASTAMAPGSAPSPSQARRDRSIPWVRGLSTTTR
ncbi:hypothetical protein [Embleya sp. NPDC059237]|uniref:hypothetical protein n=1 Tax=Embleya sp. NPDC059237 TaxID=3346784 RepID=UPI003675FE1B